LSAVFAGHLLSLALATGGGGAAESKVLLIGIDGFRADVLPVAATPVIDALIAEGCYTERALTGDITVSGPGWASYLTGVWRDKHGVVDNAFGGHRMADFPHCFARLKEARRKAVTVSIADWLPIDEHILGPTGADFRFAVDYEDDGDHKSVVKATEALRKTDPDLFFLYFADLDIAGHSHGFHPTVPKYVAELEEIDTQLGTVLTALRERRTYADEDWLVILSTDHGGTLDGAHGRDEPAHRRIPFLVSGAAARRGRLADSVNQVDVPATAFAHLGVKVDRAWGWDGRAVGLASDVAKYGENLIFNGDAEWTEGRDTGSENAGVPGFEDTGAMTVVKYGAPDGYPGPRDPGPAGRGRNFFTGGDAPASSMSQRIDLSRLTPNFWFWAGNPSFELSAWLGGYAEQRDFAVVELSFLDEHDVVLARHTIGPVTLADRRAAFGENDSLTGLVERSAQGLVPSAARVAEVTLRTETGSGSNDGYADDLSLVLRASR
jgi:hypothetical protein